MGKSLDRMPEKCPITNTMKVLGGKWKPIILYSLIDGSVRFGKLAAYIPAISRKILTEQLKELVQDGLVRRVEYAEVPPRVEYSLTPLGETAIPILNTMCQWGKMLVERKEKEEKQKQLTE